MGTYIEDIEMMRSFIQRKRKERSQFLADKLEEARRDFQKIIKVLIEEYKPKAIYQWGSLVEGSTFQEISDIDIAISGITDPEKYFKLCNRISVLSTFPIHVVQLELIHPLYADEILKKGICIYERPV